MRRSPLRLVLVAGLALLLIAVGGAALTGLYTDALWFDALGYRSVFWTRLGHDVVVRSVAGLLAAGIVFLNLALVLRHVGPVRLRRRYGNIEIAEQIPRRYLVIGVVVTALLAGWWLSTLQFGDGAALGLVAWLRRVAWAAAEPVFGRDLSWYAFALPAYFQIVDFFLLTAIWSGALVLLGYVVVGSVRWSGGRPQMGGHARIHLAALVAAVILLLGLRYWLGRYGLLLDGGGVGGAFGYTDLHARVPAHRILALLAAITAGAVFWGARRRSWVAPAAAGVTFLLAVIVVGELYPAFVQRFRVEPNEFTREAPYIEWNIDFTRRAYGLDGIGERRYPYRPERQVTWERVGSRLSSLPLWDPEPLQAAFNQVQSIFGYYDFDSIDFDRYRTENGADQVAIGARAFNPAGLPQSARTWQTLHLNPTYLRGNGVVVSPAAQTDEVGEPRLWLENIDPVVRRPDAPAQLEIRNPALYVGERFGGYALLVPGRDAALGGSPGIDYPDGVRLGTFGRRLAFAWRYRDLNLLVSGEVTDETRLVPYRGLAQRLDAIAPFVVWDSDPYPVVRNGGIVWIVDGYTAAANFPLSRPVSIAGVGRVRYLRASVKAVVDAATGEVTLYAVEPDDPVLATYDRIFPQLFQPLDAMPEDLQRHLRYPSMYLRLQADILEQYHLDRAEDFYAGRDVWALPQTSTGRMYQPIFAMYPLPGEERPEFLLSIPFIARERQNMTALLLARSDPPNYGEIVLYELPRDQQIPGPAQIETIMEQDPVIASQLSLWRRAGSDVDLGRLRVVPVDSALLYVEPLFLSAQRSAIPELQRVIVSDGRGVAMERTLEQAVEALETAADDTVGMLARAQAVAEAAAGGAAAGEGAAAVGAEWSESALELMREAEARLRQGDWAGFGETWARLRDVLERASSGSP